MDEANAANINLNGKLLTVGTGGINTNWSVARPYIDAGRITSSSSEIVIRASSRGTGEKSENGGIYERFSLNAVIQDHKDHKVGLRLEGSHAKDEYGIVTLGGRGNNTFTGDVVVSGVRNSLFLAKTHGATAIQGDVYLRDAGQLVITDKNQLSASSRVTLSGRNSMIRFVLGDNLIENISSLIVEGGQGVCDFGHPAGIRENATRTLILDDLVIKNGASLVLRRWKPGQDHILVRKDSKNLADALKKITMEGWDGQVYLRDYDSDYYSIEGAPEPTTYGAILGGLGLVLFVWRRQKARSRGASPPLHACGAVFALGGRRGQ